MQFQREELGNGAIMSPFAGLDETPWLNPELRGRDLGGSQAADGSLPRCLESMACSWGRLRTENRRDGRVCLFVCLSVRTCACAGGGTIIAFAAARRSRCRGRVVKEVVVVV